MLPAAFVVWVAIRVGVTSLVIDSSFAQEFVEPLRDALGSFPTIFAHLDERGPYPRPEESKKYQLPGQELAILIDKPVEIRELRFERVADALDGVEGDAAHGG